MGPDLTFPVNNNNEPAPTSVLQWRPTTQTGFHNGNRPCSSSPDIKTQAAAKPAEDDDDKAAEATFPQQLMDVIEGETTAEGAATVDGERVCEWLPAGDSFVIRDKKAFEKVLPKYFSARCKFMSFIRKLYRWGFRQVEKSTTGVMIFTHKNFVRGDKQRCLKMRSIVKKQTPQPIQQRFAGLADAMAGGMGANLNVGRLQGYGSSTNQYGIMGQGNLMGNGAPTLLQQTGSQMFPSLLNQGSNNTINSMTPDGINSMISSLGGQPSLFNSTSNAPNQFSQEGSMGSMSGTTNSSNMFQAGLRLEGMQQAQQMPSINTLNTTNNDTGNGNNLKMDMLNTHNNGTVNSLNSFNSSQPAMPLTNVTGTFGNSMGGGGGVMTEVGLATEIMKRGGPGMEPWKALELAKRFNSAR